jgi:hypothetical protein
VDGDTGATDALLISVVNFPVEIVQRSQSLFQFSIRDVGRLDGRAFSLATIVIVDLVSFLIYSHVYSEHAGKILVSRFPRFFPRQKIMRTLSSLIISPHSIEGAIKKHPSIPV